MLIYCAECENACSEQADTCPKCGHPLKEEPPPLATPVPAGPTRDELEILRSAVQSRPPIVVRPVPLVQTIEKTGKKWKLMMLVSVCLMLGGCIISLSSASAGADQVSAGGPAVGGLMLTVGIIGLIVAKIGACSHHG